MNQPRPAFRPLLLGCLILLVPPRADARQTTPEARLAPELNRTARAVLQRDPLTTADIEGALVLVQEAANLKPDDADQWRLLLKVAALADRPELRREALRRILELDPEDEGARLMRLLDAIDRYQTIERRIGGYERLLAAENRNRLGLAVASRLALDLALLHQRAGDLEAFGQWLAEAAVIDPSNRDAAALALGFFGDHDGDPYARAELLVNLIMADPTDLGAQISLAQLLLDNGAYPAADRVYELLQVAMKTAGIGRDNEMLADIATVKWALGETELALGLIERQRDLLDDMHRQRMRAEDPALTPDDLAAIAAPPDTVLATVAAAIHDRLDDGQSEQALRNVRAAYDARLEALGDESETAAERARLHLELAWVTLWLSSDVSAARDALAEAETLLDLSDTARARFEGWAALREGRPEEAADRLQPLAADDSAARLGLALSDLALDRRREAARQFLSVARERPGTLLGVWAADHLADMLGQRVDLSEQAGRLNELVDTLPRALERYARQPRTAMALRVVPTRRTFDPYEPVLVDIEVTNATVLPLGIGPDGPIRPQIAVFTDLRFARRVEDVATPAFILDIDRNLRLEPGERHVIRLDLRAHQVGDALDEAPLGGATLTVTAMLNFQAGASGLLEPGLLGSTATSSLTRVDGARINESWLRQTIDAVKDAEAPDPRHVALLSHVVVRPVPEDADVNFRGLTDEARAAVLPAFARLGAVDQAWLLAVMPGDEAFEPLLNTARKSAHHLVQLAYLLFQRTGPDDPMLDAALRDEDKTMRAVVEMIRSADRADAEEAASEPDQDEDR